MARVRGLDEGVRYLHAVEQGVHDLIGAVDRGEPMKVLAFRQLANGPRPGKRTYRAPWRTTGCEIVHDLRRLEPVGHPGLDGLVEPEEDAVAEPRELVRLGPARRLVEAFAPEAKVAVGVVHRLMRLRTVRGVKMRRIPMGDPRARVDIVRPAVWRGELLPTRRQVHLGSQEERRDGTTMTDDEVTVQKYALQ